MKPTLMLLTALFFLICSTTAGAQSTTGNDILGKCKQAVRSMDNDTANNASGSSIDIGFCLGFIDGAYSGHAFWVASDKLGHRDRGFDFCFPAEATNGQMLLVFVKYLEDHPEELHEPAILLYLEAMRKGFPCSK